MFACLVNSNNSSHGGSSTTTAMMMLPPPYETPRYTQSIDENSGIVLILVVVGILGFCFSSAIYWQCTERLRSTRRLKVAQVLLLNCSLVSAMLAVGIGQMTTQRGAIAAFMRACIRAWCSQNGAGAEVLMDFTTVNVTVRNAADNSTLVFPMHATRRPVPFRGDTYDINTGCESVVLAAQLPGGVSSICSPSGAITSTLVTRIAGNAPVSNALPSCDKTQRVATSVQQCAWTSKATASASENDNSPSFVSAQQCISTFTTTCAERKGTLLSSNSTSSATQTNALGQNIAVLITSVSLRCTFNETLTSLCYCISRSSQNTWLLAASSDASSSSAPDSSGSGSGSGSGSPPSSGDDGSVCQHICPGSQWTPTALLKQPPQQGFAVEAMSVQDPAVQLSAITGGTNVLPESSWMLYGRSSVGLGVGGSIFFFLAWIITLTFGEQCLCFRYLRRKNHNSQRRSRRREQRQQQQNQQNPSYGTLASVGVNGGRQERREGDDEGGYAAYSSSASGSSSGSDDDEDRVDPEVRAAQERQRAAAAEFARVTERARLMAQEEEAKRNERRAAARSQRQQHNRDNSLASGDDATTTVTTSSGGGGGGAAGCKICFEAHLPLVRFMPCQHGPCCRRCALLLQEKHQPCPWCRMPFEETEHCASDDARTFPAGSPLQSALSTGSGLDSFGDAQQ